MTNNVLTDEQIGDLYQDWYCFFKDNPGSAALCIRAIEQAVLQSPEVQAWKRDADRWQLFISNYDEYGTVPYIDGENLRADVDAAMEKQP